ncbi:MAG: C-GCAxxG-C-C family protein [Cellulosilyticaceae bacterium]
MNKQEQGIAYHIEGYNCSQAVLGVFCEELGLSKDVAMKLASGFGGGIRCGQTCGAVTGAIMALGLREGQAHGHDQETKQAMNARTVAFQEAFKVKYGTIVCKELLDGHNITTPDGFAVIKEKGLSRSVCDNLIAQAITIVEEMIKNDQES